MIFMLQLQLDRFLKRIKDYTVSTKTMSGAGGSRPLTGRRTDPVRKHFEKIQTPENLGKQPRQQQVRCKHCLEQVSARPERMEKHLEKCKDRLNVSQ